MPYVSVTLSVTLSVTFIGDIITDITYDITYDIAHDDFYIKHHIIGWNQWLCISDSGLSVFLAPS